MALFSALFFLGAFVAAAFGFGIYEGESAALAQGFFFLLLAASVACMVYDRRRPI